MGMSLVSCFFSETQCTILRLRIGARLTAHFYPWVKLLEMFVTLLSLKVTFS